MADCLVTGGAGFIGSHLTRALLQRGHAVRILDNFSTGRWVNLNDIKDRVDVQVGDLCDPDALFEATLGVRFIFHAAALPSVVQSVQDPKTTHEINVTGTLNVLLAAREAGAERVIFSSSSSVYGDTPPLPKREDMAPAPCSPYALSKWAGEQYLRMFHSLYGLKTFSLRYFNVFGPRQNPKSQYAAVIPLFIDALQRHTAPTIYGDGEQTRDFIFVDDVVSGNLCCMDAPDAAAGHVYNLALGDRVSINELAAHVFAAAGKRVKPVYKPAREGDVRHSQADSIRAREHLGWKPAVSLKDGLQQTVDWFTSNGAA